MGLKHSSDQKKSRKNKRGFSRCLKQVLPLAEISAAFSPKIFCYFGLEFGIFEGFVFFFFGQTSWGRR